MWPVPKRRGSQHRTMARLSLLCFVVVLVGYPATATFTQDSLSNTWSSSPLAFSHAQAQQVRARPGLAPKDGCPRPPDIPSIAQMRNLRSTLRANRASVLPSNRARAPSLSPRSRSPLPLEIRARWQRSRTRALRAKELSMSAGDAELLSGESSVAAAQEADFSRAQVICPADSDAHVPGQPVVARPR